MSLNVIHPLNPIYAFLWTQTLLNHMFHVEKVCRDNQSGFAFKIKLKALVKCMSSRFYFLYQCPHTREWLSRREKTMFHKSLDVLLLLGMSSFLVFGVCFFLLFNFLSLTSFQSSHQCFFLGLSMVRQASWDKIELGRLREADWKRKGNVD